MYTVCANYTSKLPSGRVYLEFPEITPELEREFRRTTTENVSSEQYVRNDMLRKLNADEDTSFTLNDIMYNNYKNNESAGMKTLRRHLGDDIVFTSVWADAQNERTLEESELLNGEVSGNVFNVGKYTIRWTVCLFRDDDTVGYRQRIPAEHDVVAKYREEGFSVFWSENGIRKVQVISAKYGDADSEDCHHVCVATEARSMRWSESIDFIGTLKLSASVPDNEEVLFILNKYMGDSFSVSYWYKLSPDGTLNEYSEHPYNPESFNKSWRDPEQAE